MSFSRALSPAVNALANLAEGFSGAPQNAMETDDVDPIQGRMAEASRLARASAMQQASNLEELIAMIPPDYRATLRQPLLEISQLATKLASTQGVLFGFVQHKNAKTFPSSIPPEPFSVQVTKEYKSSEEYQATLGFEEEKAKVIRENKLVDAIRVKTDEVEFLRKLLTPKALFEKMARVVRARRTLLLKDQKRPTFSSFAEDGSALEAGEIRLVGWEEDPSLVKASEQMLMDCASYAFRAVAFVETRGLIEDAKKAAKATLHRSVDTVMQDATVPSASIQSLIDKTVRAEVKKMAASQSHLAKVSSFSTPRLSYLVNSLPALEGAHRSQQEGFGFEDQDQQGLRQPGHSRLERRARQTALHPPSRPFAERQGKEEGIRLHDDRRPETVEEIRRRQRQRESALSAELGSPTGPSAVGRDLGRQFRYGQPQTIPDWVLTLPYPVAIGLLLCNIPTSVLYAARFQSNVHLSPGVIIPLHIQHDLSVGMRYLFRTPRNELLIKDAYADFERRIRWRLFFAFQGKNAEDKPYDPDYEIHELKDTPGPRLPIYLEQGLRDGRNFVTQKVNTISTMPTEDVALDGNRSLAPQRNIVQEFLIAHKYVVTNTDKNLGIAVSTRDWIEEKCLDLLNDRNNYEELHTVMSNAILNSQCDEMKSIADFIGSSFEADQTQLYKFFRSQVTHESLIGGKKVYDQHTLPIFYGIPKIHKQPVKMRPIIPCHSAIQNPAAKFVSKKLKPLVKAARSVIHGTKDLAIKLSKLKLESRRKLFIVTGDVVAYYPNIPLKRCLDIVEEMMWQNEFGDAHPAQLDLEAPGVEERLKWHKLFIKCLHVANQNLITQFKDKTYRQKNGLAMGVADSPDLANLFGVYYEERCGILDNTDVPFYGRYIDDCLALVYAHSAEAALQRLGVVQFEGCVIEWEASESHAHFLDMTIYVDRRGGIEHMPYRKAGNHQERIPWISHHPLDVKRGTYLGEMSRLATLSSTSVHYYDAISSLAGLYVKRGYPLDLVTKWTSDNITKRWANRLRESTLEEIESDPGVLVLKSSFNTAWNYFDAKELGDTIFGYWRTWWTHSELMTWSGKYGHFEPSLGGLKKVDSDLCSVVLDPSGNESSLPDIRKLDILNRRFIVSRKRTRNLFDLTSLWKKVVLSRLDEDASAPDENVVVADPIEPIQAGSERPQIGDLEYTHYSARTSFM